MQTQSNYDPVKLGPLSHLVGSWEGERGHDITNSHSTSSVKNYHESITFEPVGPISNGARDLYGLRYTARAWPDDSGKPLHQELGYWFWSPDDHQIVRCFTNQNGVSITAGGECGDEASCFEMSAYSDSDEYGIASCPTLNGGSKMLSYKLKVDLVNDKEFKYVEEMHLRNPMDDDVVIHTDENSMVKLF